MPSVVVSGIPPDDDVDDNDAHLHGILVEQLRCFLTKAGTRAAAELAGPAFEHARKALATEYREQAVHIPGVIGFSKLGLGYVYFVDVIHRRDSPSESYQATVNKPNMEGPELC